MPITVLRFVENLCVLAKVLMQAQQQMAQLQAAMGTGVPMPQMPLAIDPLATPVLTLTNCFDIEELNDADAYSEIFEDMQEECGKYGTVVTACPWSIVLLCN